MKCPPWLLFLTGLLVGSVASAVVVNPLHAEGAPPAVRVAGYERFFRPTDSTGVEAGLLLLGELNCLSCHTGDDDLKGLVQTKQAPILTEVGDRIRPEFFSALLADPQAVKPGTTMPSMFADSPADDRQREALQHFLASLGRPTERAAAVAAVGRGRAHFQRFGCAACHDDPEGKQKALATSIPYGNLSAKYTIPTLAKFLNDPLHVRPSGRMPALNLSGPEAVEIASYLLRDLKLPAGLTVRYYEGSWQDLPDFDKLQPKSSGSAFSFDVGAAGRRNQFGLSFQGQFEVKAAGKYTFHLGSDDGSRMWIDGNSIITNGGIHPYQVRKAQVDLEAGTHTVRVDYFEQGGEERLSVDVEGPNLRKQPLEGRLIVPDDGRKKFEVDPQLAMAGRGVFEKVGCASCHTLKFEGTDLRSGLAAPPLKQLRSATGGCLSESPAAGLPRFALDAKQRAALTSALKSLQNARTGPGDSRSLAIHRTLTTFNCYACHERDGVGGVERERNARFQSTQPEMGDEGRIPPQLTGVGDKLRTTWLRHVFREGAKDRPYMLTRMPRFGESNLHSLVEMLPAEDARQDEPVETDFSPRKLKAAGRLLAGQKGFSCIKCHTFAGSKATGIQSLSMTTMNKRLNPGWFQRYLLKPQAYRPGTRMPAAWPNGQVLLPKILDGKAATQIHSMWVYLSDGDKATPPIGLRTAPLELLPIDAPLIYRNFIEGAGPRAIGVGYPERANLAFDANQLRPALMWQGAFIDASRHWTGRGQGFQPPLGGNVLKLVDGVPIARLETDDAAWPKESARQQGYRFLGYRLDSSGRPTFRYRFGSTNVDDTYVPFDGDDGPALRRVVKITGTTPKGGVWMRVASAPKVESLENGAYRINDDWILRFDGATKPTIRKQGNSQELLIPIQASADSEVVIQLEYVW